MGAMSEPLAMTGPPRSPCRGPEILALPPADGATVSRLIGAATVPADAPAAIVVVGASAALSASDLATIEAFARRHPGRLAVVVDGMDDAGSEYVVFDGQRRRLLAAGIVPRLFVPAISSSGEGIVSGPDRVDWYRGPTLAQWLGCSVAPVEHREGRR